MIRPRSRALALSGVRAAFFASTVPRVRVCGSVAVASAEEKVASNPENVVAWLAVTPNAVGVAVIFAENAVAQASKSASLAGRKSDMVVLLVGK